MTLAVSTAKVDITPTPSTNPYLGGYGCDATPREATGARNTLYARCLVIWDQGYPNVVVVADVLAFPRSMHQSIRQRVLAEMPSTSMTSDFILQATHTHNGPVLVDELDPFMAYGLTDLALVQSYSGWLEDEIVALVKTALAAKQTSCTLDYKVDDENFAFNREGLPYVERAVPILTARNGKGQPVAVIFGYGCHPVSAGNQTEYDGDFPAGACAGIEAAMPGIFAIFLQGAAGDQDPAGGRDWATCDAYSQDLGLTVVNAIASPGRAITGPLYTSYQEVQLPLDITNTPDNMAAVLTAYQARETDAALAWYRRHAQVMIAQVEAGSFATAIPLPLQVWKLQGAPMLQLALTGGELVSGYAVYFRLRYGSYDGIWVCGYANEIPAYIPSNELLPPIRSGGSYDGGWDTDYPGIAGGSMTVYGWLGHFRAGTGGVEDTLISSLSGML